jgi:ferric-dicitrate binding protein FerR (iron transport regulator)
MATAAKASAKRSLWVNGKGNFKTRGKRASAIVRGTYWLTEETDAGTRVQVKRGLVAVRDFVKKVTVLVPAGRSYVAKPRAPVLHRLPAFTGSRPRG